ncbi:MAG: gamma-glutamyltransferase family protein [Rhodospirillales bacterium]|nr:gamma-glutamyltransferase family protein [Rhodospirillales bacterium]
MALGTFTTRPELIGTFGGIATTHWLATATGMAILEKGGNAFDAAVAAGFALQVVEPHLNGPGGEVPMVIHSAEKNKTMVVCGQGVAPAGATIEHYKSEGLDLVPGSGLLATCVPGSFDAWMMVLRDFGSLTVRDVLEPAVNLSRTGFAVVPRMSATINSVRELFATEWTESAKLYLPNGKIPENGSLFRNPEMANMYARVITEAESAGANREAQIEFARRTWSQGFIAETIDAFCRNNEVMDTSGERHRGVLTGEDMAKWQASIEAPLTYDYKNYTVCKCGPWSQGPVFLQQLALLKGFGLADMDPLSPDFIHTVTECSKLAFADREAYYGDPDFVDVPMETLLSDAYNDGRRKLISETASLEFRPGEIAGYDVSVDYRVSSGMKVDGMGGGEPTVSRAGETKGDTVHIDVVDRFGNMVSATPSGGWLQSSPLIPGLGFCLGSRAQMFWLEEGTPASLKPGKRPRTTLTPSLALRDGEPYMAFGTPGGDSQDQWTLTFLVRLAHYGYNLQECIDAPMFQNEHMPSSFYPREARPGHVTVEGRLSEDTVRELRRRGHDVEVDEDWSLGRITAVAKDGEAIKAAANARFMQGYAICR